MAIVDVALSTSMITTILELISYRFNRAGEKEVYKAGFTDIAWVIDLFVYSNGILTTFAFSCWFRTLTNKGVPILA